MSSSINLVKQRFSSLVVRRFYGTTKQQKTLWLCDCDCGNIAIITTGGLRSGNNVSCGCVKKNRMGKLNLIHGKSNTREYIIWKHMIQRCLNAKNKDYHFYGGRGIKICDRWLEPNGQGFKNFLEDMGPCPEGLTLERKNNDGNYCIENCVWATRREQGRNRSNSLWLESNGQRLLLSDWAKNLRVSRAFISDRLSKNVSFPEIVRQAREFVVLRHWREDLMESAV